MKLLYNKTLQVDFDKIHPLIIAGMSTDKEELVLVNGYGTIAANDEAVNIICVFALHMPHIQSKKIWNKMEINWHMVTLFAMQYIHLLDVINQYFILRHKKTKTVFVSMNTFSVPNLDVKVCTWKSELPKENLLCSLTQPKITIQRTF